MMHDKGHGRLYRSLSLQEKPAGGLSQLLHDTTRCVWISDTIEKVKKRYDGIIFKGLSCHIVRPWLTW